MSALKRQRAITLAGIVGLSLVGGLAGRAEAAATYSTGFEDFTSPGSIIQNGWSGGAQPNLGNDNAGDQGITTAAAHTGSQSFRLSRGYGSPGQGTPFSPELSVKVPDDGAVFTTRLWFKAVSAIEDDSAVSIYAGDDAGTDRAEVLSYLKNGPGGVRLYAYQGTNADEVTLFSNVTTSDWHQLDFTITANAGHNYVTATLDGDTLNTQSFLGWAGEYRLQNSFATESFDRLKFTALQAAGADTQGFYFDDIAYAVEVPEPTSLGLLGVAAMGLLARRRRRAI